MYERKEHIEEENLDWGVDLEEIDDLQTDSEAKETEHVTPLSKEHKKIIFKKKVKATQLNIKGKFSNLLAQYSKIALLLSLLIFPYMIGFLVIAFILLSGGVPIDSFFSLKEQVFHFELWSIGSYIFITVGVIWLVMLTFLQKR